MRKFILHNLDKTKSFDLNGLNALATEPQGLGNTFDFLYKESEKSKHLVNVKPSFEPIVLKVYFNADGSDGYANYKSLLSFLEMCGKRKFLLEYNDGVTDKYADVVFKSASKTEIDEDGVFAESLTLQRESYWYEEVDEKFALMNTDADKTRFPLGFAFGFSGQVFKTKQRVINNFFEEVPISVKISGYIKNNINLYITTLDNVKIAEISLKTNGQDGRIITIEPQSKKITIEQNGVVTNGYHLTDKTKQSFLYLPQGEFYICSNMEGTDTGKIELSIKRYLLD